MSTNTSGLSSSDEVENSLEKRIEVAQRFDREKGDAKSSLKKFLGIHDDVDSTADNNMEDSSSQTQETPLTVISTTSSVQQNTLSDGIKIKEEEKIPEEEQQISVITYQSFGPINFAVVSSHPDSLESQQKSSEVYAALPERRNNNNPSPYSETTMQLDTQLQLPHVTTEHQQQVHEGNGDELSQAEHPCDENMLDNHICDVCYKSFPCLDSLHTHRKTHTEKTSYQCDICGRKCTSLTALSGHKKVHIGEKPFKCDVCEKRFARSNNLRNHKRFHTGEKLLQCDVCPKKFIHSSFLVTHAKRHTQENELQCDVCKKYYASIQSLVVHKRIHTGEKPYKCDICGKKFARSSEVCTHKLDHTGERPFPCDVCDMKFTRKNALLAHKKIHTGEKPFKCDICERKFGRASHLRRHRRVHTGERPFECDGCDKKFSCSSALVQHRRVHTGEKPFECEVCKKKFARSNDLHRHKFVHSGEKPLQCDVCDKKFIRATELRAHKKKHTKIKHYQCDECDRTFGHSSSLRNHRRTHREVKNLKCDECDRAFVYSSQLAKHKRIHTGEKPYKCDVCDKKFMYPSGLSYHEKLHTGEKNFQCDICEKTFIASSLLRYHQRKTCFGIYTMADFASQTQKPETTMTTTLSVQQTISGSTQDGDAAALVQPANNTPHTTVQLHTQPQFSTLMAQGREIPDVPATTPVPASDTSETRTKVNTEPQFSPVMAEGIKIAKLAATPLLESENSEKVCTQPLFRRHVIADRRMLPDAATNPLLASHASDDTYHMSAHVQGNVAPRAAPSERKHTPDVTVPSPGSHTSERVTHMHTKSQLHNIMAERRKMPDEATALLPESHTSSGTHYMDTPLASQGNIAPCTAAAQERNTSDVTVHASPRRHTSETITHMYTHQVQPQFSSVITERRKVPEPTDSLPESYTSDGTKHASTHVSLQGNIAPCAVAVEKRNTPDAPDPLPESHTSEKKAYAYSPVKPQFFPVITKGRNIPDAATIPFPS